MQIPIWIIFIALIYILFEHTSLLIKCRRLQQLRDSEFVPQRMIFLYDKDTKDQMQKLYEISINTHAKNNIEVRLNLNLENGQYIRTIYENANEVLLLDINSTFPGLADCNATDYMNKIFVGNKLPEGAIRASIEKLGLLGYAFTFGYCKGDDENEKN